MSQASTRTRPALSRNVQRAKASKDINVNVKSSIQTLSMSKAFFRSVYELDFKGSLQLREIYGFYFCTSSKNYNYSKPLSRNSSGTDTNLKSSYNFYLQLL